MAIVSFWSECNKGSNQTLSLVSIATYMAIEHNYKTLIIDANLNDETISRCFWKESKDVKSFKQELNMGKVDIVAGTEGLLSAIASNKTAPEIISTYTRVVFKNRLDILLGLKAISNKEYEKNLGLYADLINSANKFYDLVIVDLPKTASRDSITEILKKTDVLVYTMEQNLTQIDTYVRSKKSIEQNYAKVIIPLLTNVDNKSKYNERNVATYIKEKKVGCIYHCTPLMEAANEGNLATFFTGAKLSKKSYDTNYKFLTSVGEMSKLIINKFEEIKYGKIH